MELPLIFTRALASARRLALALRGHLDARGGVVFADDKWLDIYPIYSIQKPRKIHKLMDFTLTFVDFTSFCAKKACHFTMDFIHVYTICLATQMELN